MATFTAMEHSSGTVEQGDAFYRHLISCARSHLDGTNFRAEWTRQRSAGLTFAIDRKPLVRRRLVVDVVQRSDDLLHRAARQRIVDRLRLAPRLDEPLLAQFRKVLRQRRLA